MTLRERPPWWVATVVGVLVGTAGGYLLPTDVKRAVLLLAVSGWCLYVGEDARRRQRRHRRRR